MEIDKIYFQKNNLIAIQAYLHISDSLCGSSKGMTERGYSGSPNVVLAQNE